MAKAADKEFQERVRKIETLIQDIDRINDPAARTHATSLVQALLDLHGTGLERMLETIYDKGVQGALLIEDFGRDELISALLLLHGLHPFTLQERVMHALEKVRPYMKTHGGNVELVSVTDDNVVRLKLAGSCNGCASSRVTLKYAVEDAIYTAAPDVAGIETEGVVDAPVARSGGLIQVSDLIEQGIGTSAKQPNANGNGNGWMPVDLSLASLGEGKLRVMQVSGINILFCRVADNYYAYANTCPNCRQLLGQAKLAGKELTCSTCGHQYDVMRAGRDLDDHNLHLEPFPLLQEEQGQVKIAMHQ